MVNRIRKLILVLWWTESGNWSLFYGEPNQETNPCFMLNRIRKLILVLWLTRFWKRFWVCGSADYPPSPLFLNLSGPTIKWAWGWGWGGTLVKLVYPFSLETSTQTIFPPVTEVTGYFLCFMFMKKKNFLLHFWLSEQKCIYGPLLYMLD